MLFSLLIAHASASTTYPAAIEAELEMPCAPTCILCHETNGGGAGTVTRDFGLAMMDRGLTGGSATDLLSAALAQMESVDSDGDGTPDPGELAVGGDPNPDAAPFCEIDGGGEPVLPVYGCFGGGESAAGMGLGALLGLASLRRRQRDS